MPTSIISGPPLRVQEDVEVSRRMLPVSRFPPLILLIFKAASVFSAHNLSGADLERVCEIDQAFVRSSLEWDQFWRVPSNVEEGAPSETSLTCHGKHRLRLVHATTLNRCILFDAKDPTRARVMLLEPCSISRSQDVTDFVRQFAGADLGYPLGVTSEDLRRFQEDVRDEGVVSSPAPEPIQFSVLPRLSKWAADVDVERDYQHTITTVRTEVETRPCPCTFTIPRFLTSDPYAFVLVTYRDGERNILRLLDAGRPSVSISKFVIRENDPSFDRLARLILGNVGFRGTLP